MTTGLDATLRLRRGEVLYDSAVEMPVTGVMIRSWKPPIPGIREVFHAWFRDHAYLPHTHDTWTLFIVDDGAIRYDLDRQARTAEPEMVSVLPPHVVHDGRAATSHGFRKRVLYLETSVLGEQLIGPAVNRPIIQDRALRREVSLLHEALSCIDDTLEAETRLALVAQRVREHLGFQTEEPLAPVGRDLAERLRAFLDAHVFEPVTMRPRPSTLRRVRRSWRVPSPTSSVSRRTSTSTGAVWTPRATAFSAASR